MAVVLALPLPAVADELNPPLRVSFSLADGVVINGDMTRWDADGFDGSFGKRRWYELERDDVWRLFRRLMDDQSAEHWIMLGRNMLIVPEGAGLAEQAFARALRLDPAADARVKAAREEALAIEERRRETENAGPREHLATGSPEGRAWPSQPWPALDADEQRAARLSMLADAKEILTRAGVEIEPMETDLLLVYSDLPRRETARLVVALEKIAVRLNTMFGRAEDANPFWGKPVVLILSDRKRFEQVESASFRQLVPLGVTGVCHYRGPKVFVSMHRDPDDLHFEATLRRQFVLGYMHRHVSPRRPPAWANEGLAEYFAQEVYDESPITDGLRPVALQFVRGGFPVGGALDLRHDDGSWPGPGNIGPAIGYLLVEFLIERGPERFRAWIDAIKSGEEWPQALRDRYGTTREQLLASFVQFYRVND